MGKMVWIVIIILFSMGMIHYTVDYMNSKKTVNYIKSFPYNDATQAFPQAASRLYAGKTKPFKRAVLLLHGYSASPQEFTLLYQSLEQANLPYYAPRLLGFGLGTMHWLRHVTPQDFLRNALDAYDLLVALADQVDIIGHSNGGTLAMLISQVRPVNKMVLSAPYFMVAEKDLRYKKWLEHPIIGKIILFLIPVFQKPTKMGTGGTSRDTLNRAVAKTMFHYPALPLQSLLAIWQLQDQLNLSASRAQSVYLLYGGQDAAFPLQSIVNWLKKGKFHLTISAFPHSAHNVFEDYDAKAVNKAVIEFLK